MKIVQMYNRAWRVNMSSSVTNLKYYTLVLLIVMSNNGNDQRSLAGHSCSGSNLSLQYGKHFSM